MSLKPITSGSTGNSWVDEIYMVLLKRNDSENVYLGPKYIGGSRWLRKTDFFLKTDDFRSLPVTGRDRHPDYCTLQTFSYNLQKSLGL